MIVFIIVCITIILFLTWGMIHANKANKKKVKKQGYDSSKFIFSRKYAGGHPNIDETVNSTKLLPHKKEIIIFNTETITLNEIGRIPMESVKNVIVEDQSTFEDKVTAGRLLLVGVFALAWKKSTKKGLAYLTIEWNDGKFDHSTMFEFDGSSSMDMANMGRNDLLRHINRELSPFSASDE